MQSSLYQSCASRPWYTFATARTVARAAQQGVPGTAGRADTTHCSHSPGSLYAPGGAAGLPANIRSAAGARGVHSPRAPAGDRRGPRPGVRAARSAHTRPKTQRPGLGLRWNEWKYLSACLSSQLELSNSGMALFIEGMAEATACQHSTLEPVHKKTFRCFKNPNYLAESHPRSFI